MCILQFYFIAEGLQGFLNMKGFLALYKWGYQIFQFYIEKLVYNCFLYFTMSALVIYSDLKVSILPVFLTQRYNNSFINCRTMVLKVTTGPLRKG